MLLITENEIHYGLDLRVNQKHKETNPKLTDVIILKIICKNRPEKSNMKSFFIVFAIKTYHVLSARMAYHILFEDHFARVIRFV